MPFYLIDSSFAPSAHFQYLILIIIIVVSASHLVLVWYTFRVCPLEYYCFLKDCIVGSCNFMLPFQVLYVAP